MRIINVFNEIVKINILLEFDLVVFLFIFLMFLENVVFLFLNLKLLFLLFFDWVIVKVDDKIVFCFMLVECIYIYRLDLLESVFILDCVNVFDVILLKFLLLVFEVNILFEFRKNIYICIYLIRCMIFGRNNLLKSLRKWNK